MIDADVIITACAPTRACFVTASTAIRTCAATADANVVVAANNMPVPEFKAELHALTLAVGGKWNWCGDGPFKTSVCYNSQIAATAGKYYGLFAQDVIFYDLWLHNLIKAWEAEPDYFTLTPYSFNTFRPMPRRKSGILECHPHCLAGTVFRRDRSYRFDESLGCMEDTDFFHWLVKNDHKEGVVLNSRVDHLGQVVQSELGGWGKITGLEAHEGGEQVRKKWGLNDRNQIPGLEHRYTRRRNYAE